MSNEQNQNVNGQEVNPDSFSPLTTIWEEESPRNDPSHSSSVLTIITKGENNLNKAKNQTILRSDVAESAKSCGTENVQRNSSLPGVPNTYAAAPFFCYPTCDPFLRVIDGDSCEGLPRLSLPASQSPSPPPPFEDGPLNANSKSEMSLSPTSLVSLKEEFLDPPPLVRQTCSSEVVSQGGDTGVETLIPQYIGGIPATLLYQSPVLSPDRMDTRVMLSLRFFVCSQSRLQYHMKHDRPHNLPFIPISYSIEPVPLVIAKDGNPMKPKEVTVDLILRMLGGAGNTITSVEDLRSILYEHAPEHICAGLVLYWRGISLPRQRCNPIRILTTSILLYVRTQYPELYMRKVLILFAQEGLLPHLLSTALYVDISVYSSVPACGYEDRVELELVADLLEADLRACKEGRHEEISTICFQIPSEKGFLNTQAKFAKRVAKLLFPIEEDPTTPKAFANQYVKDILHHPADNTKKRSFNPRSDECKKYRLITVHLREIVSKHRNKLSGDDDSPHKENKRFEEEAQVKHPFIDRETFLAPINFIGPGSRAVHQLLTAFKNSHPFHLKYNSLVVSSYFPRGITPFCAAALHIAASKSSYLPETISFWTGKHTGPYAMQIQRQDWIENTTNQMIEYLRKATLVNMASVLAFTFIQYQKSGRIPSSIIILAGTPCHVNTRDPMLNNVLSNYAANMVAVPSVVWWNLDGPLFELPFTFISYRGLTVTTLSGSSVALLPLLTARVPTRLDVIEALLSDIPSL